MSSEFIFNINDEMLQKVKIDSKILISYLSDPNKTEEDVINSIIEKYRAEFKNKTKEIEKDIQSLKRRERDKNENKKSIEEELTKIKENIKTIKAKIKTLTNEYIALFPDDNGMLGQDLDYDLSFLKRKTNWFVKNFGNYTKRRREICDKFDELEGLGKQLSDEEERVKIREERLKSVKSELETVQTEIDSAQRKLQQIYTPLLQQMHKEIANCKYAFSHKHELHKFVPPIYGISKAKEPVAVIISLKACLGNDIISALNKDEKQVKRLLEHAGLPVGNTPDSYQFFTSDMRATRGSRCVSFMTPFFSPETAMEQIRGLLTYLAEHGVEFRGVVKPFRHFQIDPVADLSEKPDEEKIIKLIQKKSIDGKVYCSDSFSHRLPETVLEKNALYRGQTFMTSDPRSSYATITDRPGAFGAVYASTDADYASEYAGFEKPSKEVAGKTLPRDRVPTITVYDRTYNVGLFSVYRDNHNVMYGNMGLEKDWGGTRNATSSANSLETQIDVDLNPLIKRYFVCGDKLILIDENDPEWKEILDYFAPNLDYVYNNERSYKTMGCLKERLELLRSQCKENNGRVLTYDMTPMQMEKMGIKIKSDRFQDATTRLKTATDKQNANPHIIKENEHSV